MEKSIKQKLREAEKQSHKEFRQQLVDDVGALLEQWVQHEQQLINRKEQVNKQCIEAMQEAKKEVDEVDKELTRIKNTTITEIKKLKQGQTWKFYLSVVGTAILASLFTIFICAAYWPQIRQLIG